MTLLRQKNPVWNGAQKVKLLYRRDKALNNIFRFYGTCVAPFSLLTMQYSPMSFGENLKQHSCLKDSSFQFGCRYSSVQRKISYNSSHKPGYYWFTG